MNPFYYTSFEEYIDNICAATYNVNVDGYLWYRTKYTDDNSTWKRKLHRMYRGSGANRSGVTGVCETEYNGARDLDFNFNVDAANNTILSGGLAVVASNYIDMFTKFTYEGGTGSGLHSVPGMINLHGESVTGFGLFIKSQFNGTLPEKRRATCEKCGSGDNFPMGKDRGADASLSVPEMTYIGFHDDARIYTHNQKSWLEAPVIEFFGHAEFNTFIKRGSRTKISLKADSLIFHDSVIFDDNLIELLPFTTDATKRANDMRYGVINDKGSNRANYSFYGPAIEMEDRGMPVLELGYQRCNEPLSSPHRSPNNRSNRKEEAVPTVGGDIIVAFKHGFELPIFNSIVANHARISFITDSFDNVKGGEYLDAFLRTDLLRIRNKVEFYTDPANSDKRSGKFVMASLPQMDDEMVDPGMYTRHLHMEPGSELSIPGEDSIKVVSRTVVGGYGTIHENIRVLVNGAIAPGFASLMEGDCQTSYDQGKLTIHNLQMEKDSEFRISLSNRHWCYDAEQNVSYQCSQTDTLVVQDTVFFTDGQVKLVVLPETTTVEPGCYLFLEYGDTLGGPSAEYVKNLVLTQQRYGDYYFSLYYGEIGKVYLCVSTFPLPVIQRKVTIEQTAGVVTNPVAGEYFVIGHQHFKFTAQFSGSPLKVTATGFYSHQVVDLDYHAVILDNGVYQYTISNVVEPWTVKIGPEPSTVSNEGLSNQKVWAYKNTLYINAERDDVVSIYNVTGVLHKKLDITEGLKTLTLERGIYVVTLKDGSVHKIIIQ